MPTDSAPMVIALGEAYTGNDKGLPQNAVAARKWFRVRVHQRDPMSYTGPSFKRSPEIRQRPHGDEIDADEGLDAGDDAHPALGAKGVLAGLHAGT